MVADENSEQTVDEQNEAVNAENSATDEKVEPDEQSPETLVTESIEESSEEDLEAKMAAAMSGKIDDSEDDLETQMAAAMAGEIDDSEDGLEAQMAAAMSDESDESMEDALSEEGGEDMTPVRSVSFQQLAPSDEIVDKDNIDRLMDVGLNLSVELGRKEMQIREILGLGPGKIIELDKLAGEPVDLLVNGKLLAKGEVVVVDENFGVRITELIDPINRIKML